MKLYLTWHQSYLELDIQRVEKAQRGTPSTYHKLHLDVSEFLLKSFSIHAFRVFVALSKFFHRHYCGIIITTFFIFGAT